MGIVVSLIGASGSGKTSSMRNVVGSKDSIMFRPSRKPVAFRKKLTEWDSEKKTGDYIFVDSYEFAIGALDIMANTYGKKVIIIEDSTFFMTDYFMETINEVGFAKFSNNASGYYNLIKAAEALPEDVVVYLVNHTDNDAGGFKKVKTIGKMLDEKVDIPSLLTVMLEAGVVKQKYTLQTNKSGAYDLCKSPAGMFNDLHIPNDLMVVDKMIREYYFFDSITYSELSGDAAKDFS